MKILRHCAFHFPPTFVRWTRATLFALAMLSAGNAFAVLDVTTLAATNIDIRQATLVGSVKLTNSSATCFFEWGATTNYGLATGATNFSIGTGTSNWSSTITGLLPGTTYHYRAVATNAVDGGAGLDAQFTTMDADALVSLAGGFVGYANGGVGFSFVPSVDIEITQIGYLAWTNALEPFIGFWTSNTLFAGTDMDLGTDGQMIYTAFPLTLAAGQQYSIVLQDLQLNSVVLRAFSDFTIAPELTNYTSEFLTTGGVFTNFSAGVFYLGPTFSYRAIPAPPPPLLRIFLTSTNTAVVAWPAPSTGFVLQQNTNLATSTWINTTNPVNVVGNEKQIQVFPLNENCYYRLKK